MAWTIGKSIESYIIVVYMVILKFNLYVWYCVRKTFVRDITKARPRPDYLTAPLPMLPGFSSLHEILQCLDVGEARLRGAVAPETARGVSSFFARSGVYIYIYILHMEYNIPPHQHIIYIYMYSIIYLDLHICSLMWGIYVGTKPCSRIWQREMLFACYKSCRNWHDNQRYPMT